MPCYHPLTAYRQVSGQILFAERRAGGGPERTLLLPCGRCIGCRLERSRQWAVRCVHEAKLYDENCFITLTYDPAHLPEDLSLKYVHYQKFMKRLRRRFFSRVIRFYMCGEYGENFGRPHYHSCLFNLDFPDKLFYSGKGETRIYTSKTLDELWGMGGCKIGRMTFESAAYVARYCTQTVTGQAAEEHYKVVNKETGEIFTRVPEFGRMSLKPGIGAPWLAKYMKDVYPKGEVVINGRLAKPPRYYDKIYERVDTDDGFARMQWAREIRAARQSADQTADRLAVKEQVTEARLQSFKRIL